MTARCPKCGGHNISFQREFVGGNVTGRQAVYVTNMPHFGMPFPHFHIFHFKHADTNHGCLFWLLGGWLISFALGWCKFFALAVAYAFYVMFYAIRVYLWFMWKIFVSFFQWLAARTRLHISAKNITTAVCQDCGYTWKR